MPRCKHFGLRGLIVGLTAGLIMVVAIGGCATTRYLDLPNAGRTIAYSPGVPNFDMEAIVTWRDGRPGVDLYMGIPRTSLMYFQSDSVYIGYYQAFVRVMDAEGEMLLSERTIEDTVRARSYEATQAYERVVDTTRLALESGRYVIEVALEDRQSRQQALRRVRIEVPASKDPLYMSRIRFQRQESAEPTRPALALHLQTGFDTLRSVVELHKASAQPVEVRMRLLRFVSDTSAAAPPSAFTPFRGSIEYKGVDYSRADTMQSTRRQIKARGDVVLEFVMPALEVGVYKVEVRANKPDGVILLDRARIFAVKSAGFPRIKRLGEMIQALQYIADEDEMEHMQSAENPAEMRRRFDAFWGRLIPQRQRAANVLENYYGRIQEANLRFSSHKAGWKSDRGMVYVMLGEPIDVRRTPQSITWHYSYNNRDPLNTFVFRRVDEVDDVFEHVILQRRQYYEIPWRNVIERWRQGEVI